MQNTLITIGISALVGLVVWAIQSAITSRRVKRIENERVAALDKATIERERREAIAAGHEALLLRVTMLEKLTTTDAQTLALLKQEMLPMAEAMKRKLVEILTHPGDEFVIPDSLLAKVKQVEQPLNEDEKLKLAKLLTERATSENPHVTEQEKLAAEALPIIMKLAELEAKEAPTAEITEVQLVTSTSKTQATKKEEEKP